MRFSTVMNLPPPSIEPDEILRAERDVANELRDISVDN